MIIQRPDSCPKIGEIDAFDAGWIAHEVGITRETVLVLSPSEDARNWALLAWNIRELMYNNLNGCEGV